MEEFKLQFKLLKTVGFFENESFTRHEAIRNNYLWIFSTFVLIYNTFAYFSYVYTHLDDVLELAECLSSAIINILAVSKLIFCAVNAKKIFELTKDIVYLNRKWKFMDTKNFIAKANELDRKVFMGMWTPCIGGCLIFWLVPILKIIISLAFQQPFDYQPAFKTESPFNYHNIPGYFLLFIDQMCSSYASAVCNCGLDTLFFGMCINLCAHFEILAANITEMELKEFVEYHLNILVLSEKVNKLFKFIVFIECLIISFLLCVISIQISKSDDISIRIPPCFQFLAIMVNLLIYCYSGQNLMDSAGDVCKEYNKMDKDYLIVMMRAKYELKIQSFFYHVSLPEFTTNMNRCMSLIALLESFL